MSRNEENMLKIGYKLIIMGYNNLTIISCII